MSNRAKIKEITDGEITPLTGIRFMAAFYVFLFHLHIRWPLSGQPWIKSLLEQGAVGMGVFFMLSGFVLAFRYVDGKTSYREYVRNRFARIYPIYVVAALLTLPWIGIGFDEPLKLTGLVLADALVLQGWIPGSIHYWNNGASWSISVEAFCYALLPLLLVRLKKLPSPKLIQVALAAYAIATICGLLVLVMPHWWLRLAYSVPLFRLPEFIVGICAFLLFTRGHTKKAGGSAVQLTLLAVAVMYLGFFGSKMPGYVTHHWLMVPLIAVMFLSVAQGRGLVAALLATPLFVWLGRVSYCFYSFQPVVILPLIDHRDALVEAYPIFADNRLLGLAAFAVLLTLSALGHHLIEEPMRRRIRRKSR